MNAIKVNDLVLVDLGGTKVQGVVMSIETERILMVKMAHGSMRVFANAVSKIEGDKS